MTENDWEKLLKIKTTGRDDTNSDTYRYPYEPTAYAVLERLANEGYICKKNTLLDYGCGKGRVDFFLSYQTKCKSIGVEYDEHIFERAMVNKENSVSGAKVTLINSDAKEYTVSDAVDRIFFFNPFSTELLGTVLSNIYDSYYRKPREMLLFFYYPSDEYISFLMREDMLSFYDEIDCQDLFNGNDSRERIMIFQFQ